MLNKIFYQATFQKGLLEAVEARLIDKLQGFDPTMREYYWREHSRLSTQMV